MPKDEVVNAAAYQDLKELTRWAKSSWATTPAQNYVPIATYGIG